MSLQSDDRPEADWAARLGVLDDGGRARALALRLGRRGALLAVLVATVVLLEGDEGYRSRHGISAWWLVLLGPSTMVMAGAIVGALLRHARSEQRSALIVALAALPGATLTAAVVRAAGAAGTLSPVGLAVITLLGCAICSWQWGGAVHALHDVAFSGREPGAR